MGKIAVKASEPRVHSRCAAQKKVGRSPPTRAEGRTVQAIWTAIMFRLFGASEPRRETLPSAIIHTLASLM